MREEAGHFWGGALEWSAFVAYGRQDEQGVGKAHSTDEAGHPRAPERSQPLQREGECPSKKPQARLADAYSAPIREKGNRTVRRNAAVGG